MCGIGGVFLANSDSDAISNRLARMQARLRHRGPDDEGQYIQADAKVGLVHSRLSILDLTPAGHQPMVSADSRYVIVFNGEIYNFKEIRRDLESTGYVFNSHSDTEVILNLFHRDGIHCVKSLQGMFAFAVWDTIEQKCFLARDPLGIKPLYYWQHDGNMAFASEMRAVLEADLGPRRLDAKALHDYFLFGSVQEPETLVDGIKLLAAGNWMVWSNGISRLESYWTLQLGVGAFDNSTEAPNAERWSSNGKECQAVSGRRAIELTRAALTESVRQHHISDVPVNLFLSGGIDSTALLALSRECGFDNLSTFSISFDDARFNEGDLARRTAEHFHSKHHDWRMSEDDGRRLILDFLDTMDQPSNDGFNTYCVSKFAHESEAKVVLSGLGGDELFGGYPSFGQIPKLLLLHQWTSMAGAGIRGLAGSLIQNMATTRYQRLGEYIRSNGSASAAYWAMRGFFLPREARQLVNHYSSNSIAVSARDMFGEDPPQAHDLKDSVSFLEITRYMRNQLLRDSDVMSMAWGLELRVPFVDQKLVNSISSIPAAIRLKRGKQLLCDAVPEIPDWIRSLPKRGFCFPFEDWISRQWADVFEQIRASSPVNLNSWFRVWTIFALEHFLKVNKIDTDCDFAIGNLQLESLL